MKAIYTQLLLILKQITVLRTKLIVQVAKDSLGKDASPLDRVDDIVGCVESVTEILVKVGVWNKVEVGTYTFWKKLAQSNKWVLVSTPKPGDIIISPTGLGNGSIQGHVGIVGDNGIIFSNDSYTGKWMTHYTINTWEKRYGEKGGFPIYYFRLL